jgi:hypothetical protein
MLHSAFVSVALASFLAVFALNAFGQAHDCTVMWDSALPRTQDSCFSASPQVIAQGDTIDLLWETSYWRGCPDSSMGIFYSHSFDAGKTFSPARQLEPLPGITAPGAPGSGNMAISGNQVYIIYLAEVPDSPSIYFLGFRSSTDAGVTWGPRRLLGDLNPEGITAHDSSVYIRFGYDDTTGGHHHFYSGCMASHNYGRTFEVAAVGLPPSPGDGSPGFGTMTYRANFLHFVYSRLMNVGQGIFFEILYTRSGDQGHTWTIPDTLSTIDSLGSAWPRIVGDESGNLSVVWYDFKYGGVDLFHGSVILRRSMDNGQSWESEQLLSYTPSAISPTITSSDQTVAVVWNEYRDPNRDRILMRISYDNGVTWCDTTEVDTLGGDITCTASNNLLFISWFRLRPSGIFGVYYGDIWIRGGRIPSTTKPVLPERFSLFQSYPNPFNNSCTIIYDLPLQDQIVTLRIYDLFGRTVGRLVEHQHEPRGRYRVIWQPEGMASGVYYYQLTTGVISETKKLILLK